MSGHHHHDHGGDLDWNSMGETIERRGEIYAPMYEQIVAAARGFAPRPARIVDAGSGPGVVSLRLAAAYPEAEVVALDSAPALLERAAHRAAERDVRLRTVLGTLPDAFAELADVDVMWLGQSLHHVGDQRAALAAAARTLAPGGVLVLLEGGLPARWLPRDIGFGRPGLQSRITAANEEWFAAMRASLPGSRQETEDWPALLAAAGLTPTARTFLLDLPAPVTPAVREHLATTMQRERDGGADHLAADDLAALDRLLDPDDPAGLHRRPDLFLLDAQTVYFAVRS
ncbi:class I SAM-dependent methyltransferase [Actinocatenispora rupis]|uniref:SAM-dependent methyltransferase n=1 Tax=Actinocatenispora rupis TaxID=519421 RepID=A0A8J3IY67_9ACTN|nr:class I SAM-dependent methyltransferase [Actinocatenispora rupis]GID10950.1 SAM-dependent methyltransferase [Actinocatenispora rupis]